MNVSGLYKPAGVGEYGDVRANWSGFHADWSNPKPTASTSSQYIEFGDTSNNYLGVVFCYCIEW